MNNSEMMKPSVDLTNVNAVKFINSINYAMFAIEFNRSVSVSVKGVIGEVRNLLLCRDSKKLLELMKSPEYCEAICLFAEICDVPKDVRNAVEMINAVEK